jgi:uncharacterized coiled-coil protein SlyX
LYESFLVNDLATYHMSKLGIGLLYFALVGAVFAAIFGYLLIQKYQSSQVSLSQTQQSLTVSKKETKTANAKADAADQARDQAQKELTETQGKVDDLNTKLATAQKQQDDLNTQLSSAQADADKAKKDLQHVTDVLGNMSPEDIKTAMQKAQSDLAGAQTQEKILQDQLQASQKQIADLHDAINRRTVGTMPPGISGKVTFVNRAWNNVDANPGRIFKWATCRNASKRTMAAAVARFRLRTRGLASEWSGRPRHFPEQRFGQAPGLAPENQEIIRLETRFRVGTGRFRRQEMKPGAGMRGAEGVPIRPGLPGDVPPIIHPGPFQGAVIELEPERFDQVQTVFVAAQRRAIAPVFGGISGSTRTIWRRCWDGHEAYRISRRPIRPMGLISPR